jgi:hypothetical protein
VPFAQVSIDGKPSIPVDSLGGLRLPRTVPGKSRIRVQRIGFTPLDTVLDVESTSSIRLTLQPIEGKLDAVLISADRDSPLARRGFYDRMRRVRLGAQRGEFITPEDITMRPGASLASLFQGRTMVSVSRSRPLILTGRGGCTMQVLLDGRVVDDSFLDDLVSVTEVAAVEIYGSMANAPGELVTLSRRGSCGLVVIWTGASS